VTARPGRQVPIPDSAEWKAPQPKGRLDLPPDIRKPVLATNLVVKPPPDKGGDGRVVAGSRRF